MRFTVKADISAPVAAALAARSSEAEHAVAIQVRKDTAPYVPMRGNAAGLDKRTQVVGNTVIYPGPYARFLYYGKVMIYPPTGSAWAPKGGTKVVTDRNLVFTKDFHPQAQAFWFEASKAENKEKWKQVAQKAVDHFG